MANLSNGSGEAKVASSNFERALAFVLDHECRAYGDIAGEPDEPAKEEITFRDYADFRREHGMPVQDVRMITIAEARVIYRAHYWEPMHCDAFGFPLALTLFDSAISIGVGRATVWLERALGFEPDGGFGPMTLSAAKAYVAVDGEKALAKALLSRRTTYCVLVAAPGKPLNKFLTCWLDRIEDLNSLAGLASE